MRESLVARLERIKRWRWILVALGVLVVVLVVAILVRGMLPAFRSVNITTWMCSFYCLNGVIVVFGGLVTGLARQVLSQGKTPYESLTEQFFDLNNAHPISPERVRTISALHSADMMRGTVMPRPQLWEARSQRIDACVMSDKGHIRIVITAGMAEKLNERQQTAVFLHFLSTVSPEDRDITAPAVEKIATMTSPVESVHHHRDLVALKMMRDPDAITSALIRTAKATLDGPEWVHLSLGGMSPLHFAQWTGEPGCMRRAQLLAEVGAEQPDTFLAAGTGGPAAGPAVPVSLIDGKASCPRCGAAVLDDSGFCWLCYTRLTLENPSDSPLATPSTVPGDGAAS